MKKVTFFLTTLLLIFLILNSNAQEKKEQLWLVDVEIVKPEKINEYLEINKELVKLCKEENFPIPFHSWTNGEFEYWWWYPIKNIGEQPKINEAWNPIVAKFGKDKFKKFYECLEYRESGTFSTRLDLGYNPENSRLKPEERAFGKVQDCYLKPGTEEQMEILIKKANKILKEKNYGDAIMYGYGNIGFERPLLSIMYLAKSRIDYMDLEQQLSELLGEDLKEINAELVKLLRKLDYSDMWYVKNLSYTPTN